MKKSLLFFFAVIGFVLTTHAQTGNNFDKAATMELVAANQQQIGLPVEELKNADVSASYFTEKAGYTMVYLQQTYKGIPVFNKMLVLAFKNGQLISKAGQFIDKMDELTSSASTMPSVSVSKAVQFAFAEQKVNKAITGNPAISANGKVYDFGKLAGGTENTTAELMWFPVEKEKLESVKLVWQVQVSPEKVDDVWQVRVDAATGKIISKYNILVTEQFGKQQAFTYVTERQDKTPTVINTKYNPGFNKTESPSLVSTVNYMVIPYPLEAPSFGAAAMRTNPWANAAGNASSLGWHNDGAVDYTISRGNNVWATEDTIATNQNLGLPATSSTSPDPLNFVTPPNFNVEPSRNPAMQQFCITNLFYWNNVLHDITYLYGFDEVSGNFQANNQGRGGNGNDHVLALAQSGAAGHVGNNANFLTPVDGGRGRMRMYLFDGPPTLHVNTPIAISGDYSSLESVFSTANKLANVGPVTGQVVYYNDDAGGTTHFACGAPVPAGSVAGKIALIDRGFGGATCTATVPFTTKVLNAQTAGAIAVIMVNNVAGVPIAMGGTDNTITIPAVMISQSDGVIFAAQLANNLNVTLSNNPLDGDLDNGIITHEFGHGVSNRFTGGPGNSSCLQNAEQGGEGWSDYIGLMLTTNWATATTSGGTIARGIGTYVVGQAPTGTGIRNFPYSTNIAVNPLTYANMGTGTIGTEVHNIGEIWCMAAWEMTWAIIQQENAINANLYNFSLGNTGGNSIALKLVFEGMRLQPCSPGYIDARNAILTADRNLYGGRHQCAIWTAFAKRGMGYSASQGSSASATDQTAATDLPPAPTVTTQPTDVSVLAGANATFTVAATAPINGAFIYYNWQVSTNGGATWADVSPAVTTTTLTLNAVTIGMNGNKYRCILTQGCATTTSSVATLTVSTPSGFTFTTPPPATATCPAPTTMAITLNTTSVGGFTTPINLTATAGVPGGTTVTFTPTPVTPGNSTVATLNGTNTLTAGTYVITITGIAGAVTQTVNLTYTINAGTGPGITGQPTAQTVCAGSNASFSITSASATGFQWQVSIDGGATWSNATGATASTLTLTAVTAGMNNNQYRCIASSLCGSTNSNAAVLTVNSPAAITAQPQNTSSCSGSNATFTVAATGTGLTYQWQLSTDGGATYNDIGAATSASFTATAVTVGMNNNRYRCVVTSSGVCVPPTATSAGAILTVVSSLSITSQPTDVTACAGSNVSFTVAASGATISYQWQLSTDGGATFNNIAAATSATYTITGVIAAQSGNKFRCQVTSPCGNATSNIVTLTVNSPATITAQPQNANLCAGSNATFSVTATGTGITYQWQLSTDGGVTYNNIGGATTSNLTLTAVTVGMNNNRYRCIVTSSGVCVPAFVTSTEAILTVVSSLSITSQPTDVTACAGSNVSFTVAASGATISYQWQLSTDGGVTFNNIAGATTTTFSITGVTAAQNGNRYRCQVTSPCGNGTSNVAILTVNTAPAITAHPQNASLCVGSNATFSVTATGTGLTYQWQLSTAGCAGPWNNITGATLATYSITGITAGQNNTGYRCVVTGVCTPAATSNCALLNVSSTVTIATNPAPQTICEGTNTSFTVGATGTGLTYQWQVSTDGGVTYTNLAASAVYGGVTTTTLALTAVPPTLNTNRYRCVVSSGVCTPGVSTGALLTVNTFPNIGTQPASAAICEGANASFTVAATTGVGSLSYQWQLSTNSGGTWTNIAAATTNTFAQAGIPATQNGYQFRVAVTAGCGTSNSNAATLTVTTYPVVTFGAIPVNVCKSDASFSLSAAPAGGAWSGTGVSGSSFSPSVAGVGARTITYTVSNAGCTTAQPKVINVLECAERHRRLPDFQSVFVYPNPNDGLFSIRLNTDLYSRLGARIFSADGKLAFTKTFIGVGYGSVVQIDISRMPGGVYQLFLYNDEAGFDKKAVSIIIYK